MSRVIVIEFLSLDGVMQDPDGRGGIQPRRLGFRYGPEAVAGDKFKLGEVLDAGALLLRPRDLAALRRHLAAQGRPLLSKMNRIPKLVASRSLQRVERWQNSSLIEGDLVDEVATRRADQDLVVAGSASVVHTLMAHDLVDQYRLLVFRSCSARAAACSSTAPHRSSCAWCRPSRGRGGALGLQSSDSQLTA